MSKTFFIILMVSLASVPAMAFQIGSAFTNPCHESITLKGFFADDNLQGENTLIPSGAFQNNEVPEDAVWLQVAEYLEQQIDHTFKSDFERFFAAMQRAGPHLFGGQTRFLHEPKVRSFRPADATQS